MSCVWSKSYVFESSTHRGVGSQQMPADLRIRFMYGPTAGLGLQLSKISMARFHHSTTNLKKKKKKKTFMKHFI